MKRNIDIIVAIFLVVMAASLRIMNAQVHFENFPNFVPIAAIGVFSGSFIKDKRVLAFMAPVLGQFLADVYFTLFTKIPGFYDIIGQSFNYLAIIGAVGLGTTFKNIKPLNALLYTFSASTLFFIVSNLGYFLGGWNTYSLFGLEKTYVDAIPFFKNTLAADMAGGVLLFGSYFLAQMLFAKKATKAVV